MLHWDVRTSSEYARITIIKTNFCQNATNLQRKHVQKPIKSFRIAFNNYLKGRGASSFPRGTDDLVEA